MDAMYAILIVPQYREEVFYRLKIEDLSEKPVLAKGTDVTETGVCFGHSRMFSEIVRIFGYGFSKTRVFYEWRKMPVSSIKTVVWGGTICRYLVEEYPEGNGIYVKST